MKKIFLVMLTLIVMLSISACKTQKQDSVEYVKNYIEEKGGENISFDDFGYLRHSDHGSGVIVEIYELEDNNKLLITGISYEAAPHKIEIITNTNETIPLYSREGEIYKVISIKDIVDIPKAINTMAIQKYSDEPVFYDVLELKNEDFNKIIEWLNNLRLIESQDPYLEGSSFYEVRINGEDILSYMRDNFGYIVVNHKWYSILNTNEFPIEDKAFDDLVAGKK